MLAGALKLNQSLNSEAEKEVDPPSPLKLTDEDLPDPKSADTETSERFEKGLIPLDLSSDFTFSKSQVSVPAGFDLSTW